MRSPAGEARLQGFGNVFTWSVWIMLTANGQTAEFPRPMQLLNPLGNENVVSVLTDDFERVSISLRDGSATVFKQYIGPVEPLNQWIHYAWTWDGTDLIYYRNGVDITNTTVTKFVDDPGSRSDVESYWLFGQVSTQRLSANVYSPAVWNTELSSAEVVEIFEAASRRQYTEDFGNYASSSSLVRYWDARRIHDPLNDRAGDENLFDSITIPNDPDVPSESFSIDYQNAAGNRLRSTTEFTWNIANEWTIGYWVNFDDISGADNLLLIRNFSNGNNEIFFRRNQSQTRWQLDLRDSGGTTFKSFSWDESNISTGVWYYLTMTWDGTDLEVYTNGVNETSGATKTTDNAGTMTDTTRRIYIGQNVPGTGNFAIGGNVFGIQIWDVALDDDSVAACYNGGDGTDFDLLENQGDYQEAGNLVSWYRVGLDNSNPPASFYNDYGSNNNNVSATISGTHLRELKSPV